MLTNILIILVAWLFLRSVAYDYRHLNRPARRRRRRRRSRTSFKVIKPNH